ncbi:immunoglobulin superfamily member 1-like [Heptranchias perlo]|uniref:immunoglobulin superfamily member 1-like n=1 Tax=Heptranchias perlo TaxID=212740 RepID=UPI0035596A3A
MATESLDPPRSRGILEVFKAERLRENPPVTPRIALDQHSGVYIRGEPVTLTCTSLGDYSGGPFTFYRNGQLLIRTHQDQRFHWLRIDHITDGDRGSYTCRDMETISGREVQSQPSNAVEITETDPLPSPGISLDQWTGMYLEGETVTINCIVASKYHSKTFIFYRNMEPLPSSQISIKDNIGTFTATSRNQGGRYQCQYGYFISGRWIESPHSVAVLVTIADPLTKPGISLNQPTGVYLEGETVAITCILKGEYRSQIYFYRDNQLLSSRQLFTKDNIGTLLVTNTNQGGQYQCQYGTFIKKRWLESQLSEDVTFTIEEPLAPPGISLDQSTGVYLEGERVTITCTVNRKYRGNIYYYRENQLLSSRQLFTKDNIGTFTVTGTNQGGRYQCKYGTSVKKRRIWSQLSDTVTVTITGPLTPPRISLDRSTGVYLDGETVTITCTVTGEYRGKIYFYRDNQLLSSHELFTKNNTGTFTVTGANQEGRYQCKYGTTVKRRRLKSQLSEAVTVTISGLSKPNISVDSRLVVKGGKVTFNCTNPRDLPGFTFHLYRFGEANYSDIQTAAARNNSVNFTITMMDQVDGGKYTCLYKGDVRGRLLTSAQSDPLHITVKDKSSWLEAAVGSAVVLIFILTLLGVCFWKKRKGQRDTLQTGDEDSSIDTMVKV